MLRRQLKRMKNEEMEQRLRNIDIEIQNFVIEESINEIKKFTKSTETLDGKFSQLKLWKLKQKLCPKSNDPPMAKLDSGGNKITETESLKALYLNTYKNRLKHIEIADTHKEIYNLKMRLWKYRYNILKNKKSDEWTKAEKQKAVSCLKNNKARDPLGYTNELIKESVKSDPL